MRLGLCKICVVLMALFCLVLGGCASSTVKVTHTTSMEPAPSSSQDSIPQIVKAFPDPSELPAEYMLTEEEVDAYGEDACFAVMEIPDDVFTRMDGKTYKPECTISRDELRYIRVLHKNADGEILTGELVMNESIADQICQILHELYKADYPIERMRLADDYDADDEASMEDNNSSGFNYRPIEGTNRPSKHALGMAIDINTLYNPYYRFSDGETLPHSGAAYLDRSNEFPYKISEGDLCYQLFTEHGYTWGGSWSSVKDYQHFEK